ncbi:MAG TPA: hypothetical protein VHL54_03505 [Actinomycetota bacterium]|nr:hypothetical protein [Actinomycetota bacterium]
MEQPSNGGGSIPRSLKRWLVPTFALAVIGLRIGFEADSVWAGVLSAMAIGLVLGVTLWGLRRRANRLLSADSPSPASIKGALKLNSLPVDWQGPASETFASTAQAGALSVRVYVDGTWLRFDSTSAFGFRGHPFRAQVPLASVSSVYGDNSDEGIVGSELVFNLDSGYSPRLALIAGLEGAEKAALRFSRDIAAVRSQPLPAGPTGVVSKPPANRIDTGSATWISFMGMVPFFPAMLGAEHGRWAATVTIAVVFPAILLQMWRNLYLARYVVWGTAAAAGAFLVDVALTGQTMSIVGLATALVVSILEFRTLTRSQSRSA